jgi:LysM repeat protein
MVNILVAKPERTQTMRIVTADGFQGSMHSTARGFTYQDIPNWGTIPREGKKAITRQVSPGLRKLSFTQTIASLDYQQSIEPVVQRFTDIGARGVRVRFTGGSGPFEQPCWWLIKALDVTVTQRALNNTASFATVSWSLEEWIDVTANAIRPRPVPKVPVAPPAPPQRTHRVVSGDTLWHIAQRYLGSGPRWPEIFALNTAIIKNPHWIYPGQVFRIPG